MSLGVQDGGLRRFSRVVLWLLGVADVVHSLERRGPVRAGPGAQGSGIGERRPVVHRVGGRALVLAVDGTAGGSTGRQRERR